MQNPFLEQGQNFPWILENESTEEDYKFSPLSTVCEEPTEVKHINSLFEVKDYERILDGCHFGLTSQEDSLRTPNIIENDLSLKTELFKTKTWESNNDFTSTQGKLTHKSHIKIFIDDGSHFAPKLFKISRVPKKFTCDTTNMKRRADVAKFNFHQKECNEILSKQEIKIESLSNDSESDSK